MSARKRPDWAKTVEQHIDEAQADEVLREAAEAVEADDPDTK